MTVLAAGLAGLIQIAASSAESPTWCVGSVSAVAQTFVVADAAAGTSASAAPARASTCSGRRPWRTVVLPWSVVSRRAAPRARWEYGSHPPALSVRRGRRRGRGARRFPSSGSAVLARRCAGTIARCPAAAARDDLDHHEVALRGGRARRARPHRRRRPGADRRAGPPARHPGAVPRAALRRPAPRRRPALPARGQGRLPLRSRPGGPSPCSRSSSSSTARSAATRRASSPPRPPRPATCWPGPRSPTRSSARPSEAAAPMYYI